MPYIFCPALHFGSKILLSILNDFFPTSFNLLLYVKHKNEDRKRGKKEIISFCKQTYLKAYRHAVHVNNLGRMSRLSEWFVSTTLKIFFLLLLLYRMEILVPYHGIQLPTYTPKKDAQRDGIFLLYGAWINTHLLPIFKRNIAVHSVHHSNINRNMEIKIVFQVSHHIHGMFFIILNFDIQLLDCLSSVASRRT